MKKAVSTTEDGMSNNGPPDVCFEPLVPQPPSPPFSKPVRYKNKADHRSPKKTTKNVLVRNKPCLVEGSFIPRSAGDEMGCAIVPPPGKMGMFSRTHMAKCEFIQHSSKVKMEGKGVICHGHAAKLNKGNTLGKHDKPSQSVVLAEP